ncbi:flagellar hook assembly protein FlgD [Microbulbifer litoralis]|uniref:flagellar hook assembly protein FlgD n=1 Tax=Microbulbifer litoralis TaxID=2933965 RepID=UPI00202962A8|nr:flagellar hook assembly protein FlgD [Microbulbifer sp. GX H0434]
MAVSNVIDSGVTGAMNAATGSASSASADLQDSFMTLLVTQLQNQDPMNPMENAEMTSQLAQINTVTGIEKLNDTLAGINGQLDTSQVLQASGLIGQGVLVPGSRVLVGEEGATTPFGVELGQAAEDVQITIRNDSGEVVRTFDSFSLDSGVETFTWDGTMDDGNTAPEGSYTVSIEASSGDDAIDTTALNYALVNGVSLDSDGSPLLDLGGVSEQITLDDIRQIL